ncbi:MAG: DegV family protein, partial [Clostridia bacterium]|nr:DegV family protein [Clostridia bacterium]
MIKTAISVESSADISAELALKYDIKVIPYKITLGEETFNDGEKSPEEMFAFVDKTKTLPKTTALNEFEYAEFFESLKKDYDAVIHLCLS